MTVMAGSASIYVDTGEGWQHIGYASDLRAAELVTPPSPSRLLIASAEATMTGRLTPSLIALAFGVPLHLLDSSAPHPRRQVRRMRHWARRKGRKR